MHVDFSKVKKSPVPKDRADVVQYFRGDGIKILVLASGAMQVRDSNDSVLAHREGLYQTTPTGEVKALAAAMLNRVSMKAEREAEPEAEPEVEGYTFTRTANGGRFDRAQAKPEPLSSYRSVFDFLTNGRTALV